MTLTQGALQAGRNQKRIMEIVSGQRNMTDDCDNHVGCDLTLAFKHMFKELHAMQH